MSDLHYDAPIVIEPTERAGAVDAAVIWLHGLGADGHDFEPIAPMLGPITETTRFVFPHAPMIPVTINQGMVMRAWYDISLEGNSFVTSKEGLHASQTHLEKLIDEQRAAGIASERIVIAGFSQGGAVALYTVLRHRERLGGLMALSTYLPFPEELEAERHAANANIPIFMAHGEYDPMIPLARASGSREAFSERGFNVQWHQYPMEHSVSPEEIQDIARWLNDVLSKD
ncbi:MAG: alpha/beta hydrolase [Pseudomonadota bacterium]